MRLSANWLVRNIALGFIELVRNTPQLVQIIFWYVAVLQTLPGPRQSIILPAGALLNIRGIYLPSFVARMLAPTCFGRWRWPLLLATPFVWRLRWRDLPLGARSLLLLAACCRCCSLAVSTTSTTPQLRGFNIAGGVQVVPELVALWAGLTIYARGVHRRDRARRDPVGAQGTARGGAQPGAEAAPGAVARSSCRRRCAS